MSLQQYRNKRNFVRTAEPRGVRAKANKRPIFVVQKHAASHLHYDFRLEIDGALKSWAVPKGPDTDPSHKRLAVLVEDHPLEYADFEGTIPAGEYGGGTVMVWDRGTWEAAEDPGKAFRSGKLKFVLHGKKLRGAWVLVRTRGKGDPGRQWLLFKEQDRFAGKRPITERLTASAKSGRSLQEIAANAEERETGSPKSKPRAGEARRTRAATSDSQNVIGDVRLSSPEKVLYPDHGLTKRELAEYYQAVADWMLPQVKERPLALVRCPGGQRKPCFFQKHRQEGGPGYLGLVDVSAEAKPDYNLVIKDANGLIELAQLGVLEIHTWGSTSRSLEKPNRLVFDLDPDPSVGWPQVIAAAREVRELLESLGLTVFLKTTGGKGLHLVVPIRPSLVWDEAKAFCKSLAEHLERQSPERYTANLSKAARRGRIFIDYLRNGRGATAVAAYSTRSRPGAPVSVPIEWRELSPKLRSDQFTVRNTLQRLSRLKVDPWAEIGSTRQTITKRMRASFEG